MMRVVLVVVPHYTVFNTRRSDSWCRAECKAVIPETDGGGYRVSSFPPSTLGLQAMGPDPSPEFRIYVAAIRHELWSFMHGRGWCTAASVLQLSSTPLVVWTKGCQGKSDTDDASPPASLSPSMVLLSPIQHLCSLEGCQGIGRLHV